MRMRSWAENLQKNTVARTAKEGRNQAVTCWGSSSTFSRQQSEVVCSICLRRTATECRPLCKHLRATENRAPCPFAGNRCF